VIQINKRAVRLAKEAIQEADTLNIAVHTLPSGATLLDFGVEVSGSWEAALIFSRLTLGDMGTLQLGRWELDDDYAFACVDLHISQPLIACLGSQIAGWQLGDGEFATIGSGPARSVAALEKDRYMQMTPYRDVGATEVLLCLQDTRLPHDSIALEVAAACNVLPNQVYLAIAPSACITGSVQVAARMLEQCCHKMYGHAFDVAQVLHCRGRAPVAPVVLDEVKAMGRINDAILYAGEAEFWVDCSDEAIENVIERLVSKTSSPLYGVPFGTIFEQAGRNFYEIDHEVHSIAVIQIHNVRSGNSFRAGEIHREVIRESFLS
jgi:methenyltetrahydromethanopterin cyclohydrolase